MKLILIFVRFIVVQIRDTRHKIREKKQNSNNNNQIQHFVQYMSASKTVLCAVIKKNCITLIL